MTKINTCVAGFIIEGLSSFPLPVLEYWLEGFIFESFKSFSLSAFADPWVCFSRVYHPSLYWFPSSWVLFLSVYHPSLSQLTLTRGFNLSRVYHPSLYQFLGSWVFSLVFIILHLTSIYLSKNSDGWWPSMLKQIHLSTDVSALKPRV